MQMIEPNNIPYPFTLLDTLNEGICMFDRQGRCLYVNCKGMEIVGKARDELLGKNMGGPFPERLGTRFYVEAQRAIEENHPIGIEIYDSLTKRWLALRYYPSSEGLSILILDITERKEFEQRKDDFINMASHELKTPVTALKGLTQVLIEQLTQAAMTEAISLLTMIDAQIDRLTKLVDDLLNVSKIQAGHLAYDRSPVDVDALVRETTALLQTSTPTHTLNVSGATQTVIIGDKDRLRQVIINLITNAIKYSPQANCIDILLSSTAESIHIAVRDYGIGIPKTAQQHIFDRFYRVDNKTIPGLGMGLYIAHEIVQYHGGKLTVESEEGKGSTFVISLPIS